VLHNYADKCSSVGCSDDHCGRNDIQSRIFPQRELNLPIAKNRDDNINTGYVNPLFRRQGDCAKEKSSLATIVILFGLENCDEPFKTPSALNIQPRIVCRVSYFDEILERSVSRWPSFDDGVLLAQEKTFQVFPPPVARIKKTSTPASAKVLPSNFSCVSTLLGNLDWLDKYPFHSSQAYSSHNLGCKGRSSRRLKSDCRLLSDVGRSITESSMSCQSQRSPDSSLESRASDTFRWSYRQSSRGTASPSSNISSYSRRSPLSIMRYVKHVLI
jgi:hypothetical protein